ncbi:2-hydroxyacid dehydrogenase [Psychroflexus sp. MBR-150]|jgi:phosphoglycerate dehydrogenase-like enzyme
MKNILVTYKTNENEKEFYRNFFKDHAISFLDDTETDKKEKILLKSEIIIAWNPTRELEKFDKNLFRNFRFIQLLSAGYDHLEFDMFPTTCLIAANQGAYAPAMAEHTVAMILALSKKLRLYHNRMAEGKFEQLKSITRQIKGATLGIIGFGSIGKEVTKLMRGFDVKVMALNTSGKTTEDVDFIGTLNDLDNLLIHSDFVVISIPLSDETEGLIGKKELELMKNDAILINVARGPIVKEKDLYEHLKNHPDFSAGIDAWWIEPFKFGHFKINYPFFELPNLLGSPHNSAIVENILIEGARKAAENAKKFLNNKEIKGVVERT